MTISDKAADYVRSNGLRSTMICTNCRRFERLTGVKRLAELTEAHLRQFRGAAMETGLSAATIEKTVTDVLTIVKHIRGDTLSPGKRLPQPRPEPHPLPLEVISAVYDHSTDWLKQFICLAYWTGMRLRDCMRLQLSMPQRAADCIRHTASKTGHHHCYPVPVWLRDFLDKRNLPYKHDGDHSVRVVYRHIGAACLAASVDPICMQTVRQRSVTEWTRANATAGSIIHGCGLGVLSHYLDPLSVLESAAPRVRLPSCFGVSVDTRERLTSAYERLDPQGREIILTTAERLAAS